MHKGINYNPLVDLTDQITRISSVGGKNILFFFIHVRQIHTLRKAGECSFNETCIFSGDHKLIWSFSENGQSCGSIRIIYNKESKDFFIIFREETPIFKKLDSFVKKTNEIKSRELKSLGINYLSLDKMHLKMVAPRIWLNQLTTH